MGAEPPSDGDATPASHGSAAGFHLSIRFIPARSLPAFCPEPPSSSTILEGERTDDPPTSELDIPVSNTTDCLVFSACGADVSRELATVQSNLIATLTMMVKGLTVKEISVGPGPVSTGPHTPTSTTPVATQTPTTPLTFLSLNTPDTLTTCQPANITWDFSGSDTTAITLLITDENVSQSTLATTPPTILWTLTNSADATSKFWEWSWVNLTSGYYVIQGSVPGIDNQQTSPFFIATGSDTSCLPASSSSSSSTSSPSSSTSSPTSTSIPSVGSSKKTNAGAIAGGVAGIVVMLIAIFALLFVRRKNQAGHSRRGNWGGLGDVSTESRGAGRNASGGIHKPTESTGRILNDIGPAIATATVASSLDDLDFREDEKFSSSTSSNALHNVQPIVYNPTHAHRTSGSSRQSNNSTSSATVHRGVPTADIADYHRTERSPSLPVSPRSTTGLPRATDLSSAEMIPMGRSSSSQSAMGARRASRKPVPQYDAAELEQQPSSSNVELLPFDLDAMQALNRQPSNGSVKQIHYLIPDMPPPSKD